MLVARALLLVDLSKDFIELDGALNCGEAGVQIISYCKALVQSFLASGDIVIDARDLHTVDDTEIALGLFPPHNMQGTDGQELISELTSELAKRPEQWIQVFKKSYNAGFQTPLFDILKERGITEIHVIGVCTDICVRYTLNGLYQWKTSECPELKMVVHARGVASFNETGHLDSLQHFPIAFGAEVVS